MLKRTFEIILIIHLTILVSCGDKPIPTSQGIIEYKVTYPKMDESNFMYDFMPKKMTMKFQNGKYMTDLTAGMGAFKTNFICNKEDNKFIQLVKLMNKKYAMELQGQDIPSSLEQLPKFNIEFTEEHKKILGYTCDKAIITIDDGSNDAFAVYYTDQINIDTPNWCNQFVEIDGVMLEYQYEKYDVCMRFSATEITFTEVEDEDFEISKDYISVSENEMDKEMFAIFDSFN